MRRMTTVRTTLPHSQAPYKPEPSSIPLRFQVYPGRIRLPRSLAGICFLGPWRIVVVGAGFWKRSNRRGEIGEGLRRNFALWMGKKRKSVATSLDEVDRTMYATFCSAANSLSQLYTQTMNQQKLSFQAGERHGLVRLSLSGSVVVVVVVVFNFIDLSFFFSN